MKQSAKRLISTFTALLLLIFAVIAFVYFVEPEYQEIKEVTGKKMFLEEFREEQKHVIGEVGKLIGIYENSDDVRTVVSLAFPLEPDLAQAIAQLDGLAVNNNLSPQSIGITIENVNKSTDKLRKEISADPASSLVQTIGKINFQIRLLGSYEDFKKFMGNLETNVRVFDVKNLSIQQVGKPSQNLYNFDMTISSYYQVAPQTQKTQ